MRTWKNNETIDALREAYKAVNPDNANAYIENVYESEYSLIYDMGDFPDATGEGSISVNVSKEGAEVIFFITARERVTGNGATVIGGDYDEVFYTDDYDETIESTYERNDVESAALLVDDLEKTGIWEY